jgi:hypothetical protein
MLDIVGVAAIAVVVSLLVLVLLGSTTSKRRSGTPQQHPSSAIVDGFIGAIGNTPLIHIASLSSESGCTILVCSVHDSHNASNHDRC